MLNLNLLLKQREGEQKLQDQLKVSQDLVEQLQAELDLKAEEELTQFHEEREAERVSNEQMETAEREMADLEKVMSLYEDKAKGLVETFHRAFETEKPDALLDALQDRAKVMCVNFRQEIADRLHDIDPAQWYYLWMRATSLLAKLYTTIGQMHLTQSARGGFTPTLLPGFTPIDA